MNELNTVDLLFPVYSLMNWTNTVFIQWKKRSLCPAPNTAEQSEFDCPLNEGSQPQVRGPVLVRRSFDNGPHWGHSEKNYFSFTYFLHSSVISLYFFM